MEVGLGHRTVFQLFRRAAEEIRGLEATWLPVEFSGNDFLAKIPKVRSDFVLRGGFKGWKQIRSALRMHSFDALFFHTQMPAIFCSRLMRKIPSFVSIDATPSQFAKMGRYYGLPDPERASVREKVREIFYKNVFANAQCVIGMSRWAVDAAMHEYGVPNNRTRVCLPGVDLRLWQPGSKPNEGPIRLLFVGGEFERKGGDLLLRWMSEGGNRTCTLDVVTGNSIAPAERVSVHTNLKSNDPKLIELFRTADLFVLPTRADAASLVAVEAMASGTPVLTTRIGGIPEWVGEDEQAARVIAPDNYAELCKALNTLVADRQLLRRMGHHARKRAELLFDGKANVKAELEFIRNSVEATGFAG